MSRYGSSGVTYSFGPGRWTPAVRALILTNVGVYFLSLVMPAMVDYFALTPALVLRGNVWQLVSYLFLHGDPMHILFNMLMLWMFGVELEQRWGTRAFVTFYFVCGLGAGVAEVLVSLLPFSLTAPLFYAPTIGASGAIYGVMMAWALIFPYRQIVLLIFPVQARYAVLICAALMFFESIGGESTVANFAHLGGLVTGYLYLKGPRGLQDEVRYRVTKWRMARTRRRFDVRRGGRVH